MLAVLIFPPRMANGSSVTGTSTTELTFENLVPRLAQKYGQDESLARAIISCEGGQKADARGRNRLSDGTVWSEDHGYWQINDYWHEDEALRRGFDIHDWMDNLEYGFLLLKERGTQPWNASRKCWTAKTTL